MPFQKYKNSIAPPRPDGGGSGGEQGGAPAFEITDFATEGRAVEQSAIEIER